MASLLANGPHYFPSRCPELLVLGKHAYPVADKLIWVGVNELVRNWNVMDYNGSDDTLNLSNGESVGTKDLVKSGL